MGDSSGVVILSDSEDLLLNAVQQILRASPSERQETFISSLRFSVLSAPWLSTEHVSDSGRLATTCELAVVPVLDVPGWCADNGRAVL